MFATAVGCAVCSLTGRPESATHNSSAKGSLAGPAGLGAFEASHQGGCNPSFFSLGTAFGFQKLLNSSIPSTCCSSCDIPRASSSTPCAPRRLR